MKFSTVRTIAAALLVALVHACPASALPVGAILLPASQMFQTSQNGHTYTCGMVNSKWNGGILVSGRFMPFSQLITNTKVKLRTATGKKKLKLKAKLASYKNSHSTVGSICRAAASGGGGGGSTPTHTPTPPPSSGSNFDSSGNVTAAGKALFTIPSSLSANKSRGQTVWSSTCRACHSSEYQNKRYVDLVNVLPAAPMFVHISNNQLADLVAYLNRFR